MEVEDGSDDASSDDCINCIRSGGRWVREKKECKRMRNSTGVLIVSEIPFLIWYG